MFKPVDYKIYIEFLGQVNIYFGMGVQIVFALILGWVIGLDRERKMKSAGIKTNMLICLGATLYTTVSILIQKMNLTPGGNTDAGRVAAQVVSGIGFLGAGAIMQGRGGVRGLTTAATIWVVAAIGVTIGTGFPIMAMIFTLTILVVLKLLPKIELFLETEKDFRDYHIEVLSRGSSKFSVKQILLAEVDQINELYEEVIDKQTNERVLNLYATFHPKKVNEIRSEIKGILQVEKVNIHPTEYTGKNGDS